LITSLARSVNVRNPSADRVPTSPVRRKPSRKRSGSGWASPTCSPCRPGTDAGWHFLTGSQESIKAVTDAAGFKYEWDDKTQQFAHAAAVMVVTPEGKMSRYFYGIDYAPKDIKFGIMDSAQAKVGNPAEQLLLYCYHYDPASGKYGFAILRVMRLAGVATLLGLGAMAFVFWRKNKNNGSNNGQSTAV